LYGVLLNTSKKRCQALPNAMTFAGSFGSNVTTVRSSDFSGKGSEEVAACLEDALIEKENPDWRDLYPEISV
jgi:hypothetical protein